MMIDVVDIIQFLPIVCILRPLAIGSTGRFGLILLFGSLLGDLAVDVAHDEGCYVLAVLELVIDFREAAAAGVADVGDAEPSLFRREDSKRPLVVEDFLQSRIQLAED